MTPQPSVAPQVGDDTEQQFIAAIHAAPDDDQLRLVFADWLMERGDVRGEFIRLQLQSKRVDFLLEKHWREMAGELAPFADKTSFQRGFVERVRMTPNEFTRDGHRLFSTYPLRTWTVDAHDLSPREIAQIAGARGLSRVRRLELSHSDGDVSRARLAALTKGQFFSLRELSFTRCGHDGDDWFTLFSKLNAPELECVEFSESYSHPSMLLGLAKNPRLTKLISVDDYVFAELGGGGEFAAAMRAFADQRSSLKSLILSRCSHLDDESLQPLFSSSSCVRLETFDIDGAKLSDATLHSWRGNERLSELKSLHIRDAHFTPQAVASFIDAACPPKLEQLTFTTWDELRWTMDELGMLYEVLLAVPKHSPLKRLALPQGRRGYDRLWERLSERFEVAA